MEIIEINGRSFEIHPLTRGQIKELKDFGFSYFACRPTLDQANEAMDAAFDIVLSDEDKSFLDDLPVKDSFSIWKAILAETYGGGDDEKNSKAT